MFRHATISGKILHLLTIHADKYVTIANLNIIYYCIQPFFSYSMRTLCDKKNFKQCEYTVTLRVDADIVQVIKQ